MKKAILVLILMCCATSAFASTPKLASGSFGEIVGGTIVGLFAADAIKSIFSRPAPVYYAPAYPVYAAPAPAYTFDPYTQSYVPCYYYY